MRRFVVAILVICLGALHVPAFDQVEIRKLAHDRQNSTLVAKLTELKASDPKEFVRRDYDYLLGRAAESEGMTALAAASYRSVVKRGTVLAPNALIRLSLIYRSTGNLLLEQICLREILLLSQGSTISAGAEYRLSRNALETGNYPEAIRLLASGPRRTGGSSADSPNIRDKRVLLGEAYRLSGDFEKARRIFVAILDSVTNIAQPDDAALAAVQGLDAIDGHDPIVGESEHWRRAGVYQFNRYFDEARFHYEAVFSNNRASANAAQSMFQIGRGFAQRENFVEALAWYERVLEQFPADSAAKDALLQAAAAYSRVGKQKEAIKRYESFIDRYGGDEKLDRAYLNIVDILRDQGEDTDALKWCAKTAQVFKGKTPEAMAVFAEARIYLSKEDWPRALAALDRLRTFPDLGGATVPGGSTKPEIAFLRAYVLERSGQYADAIEGYIAIADGRNEYYGWRATHRLRQLSGEEAAKASVESKLAGLQSGLKAKDADTRRLNAQSILRFALDGETRDRAVAVLKLAVRDLPKYELPAVPAAPPTMSESAKRLISMGLIDEAVPDVAASDMARAEQVWKRVPADLPVGLIPREYLSTLYPMPYKAELLRHATARGVDPRFVLAIMRQESGFQPDARSAAGARGLMQFIHTTAARVANELGREAHVDADLFDPETSILFATHYLQGLFAIFPEEYEAVAAAYNGGETNVRRWLPRSDTNQPERYMPEIVFGQSKEYAEKIMANYRMYQYLYDERLAPKPASQSE